MLYIQNLHYIMHPNKLLVFNSLNTEGKDINNTYFKNLINLKSIIENFAYSPNFSQDKIYFVLEFYDIYIVCVCNFNRYLIILTIEVFLKKIKYFLSKFLPKAQLRKGFKEIF